MDIAHFVYCSSVDEHLGCFQFLDVMNDAAVNICVQVFVWSYVFIYLRSIPRRIARSYNSVYPFEKVPICFPNVVVEHSF